MRAKVVRVGYRASGDVPTSRTPRRATVSSSTPTEIARPCGPPYSRSTASRNPSIDDAPDAVVQALRVLADPDAGATVVHCAAGKDRTGVVCAFALLVAGVPREEVVADYALTGERIEAIFDRLAGSAIYAEDMKQRALDDMRPHALSMWHFLDRLDERGGPLTWLTEQGFGPEEQAALRDRLVA